MKAACWNSSQYHVLFRFKSDIFLVKIAPSSCLTFNFNTYQSSLLSHIHVFSNAACLSEEQICWTATNNHSFIKTKQNREILYNILCCIYTNFLCTSQPNRMRQALQSVRWLVSMDTSDLCMCLSMCMSPLVTCRSSVLSSVLHPTTPHHHTTIPTKFEIRIWTHDWFEIKDMRRMKKASPWETLACVRWEVNSKVLEKLLGRWGGQWGPLDSKGQSHNNSENKYQPTGGDSDWCKED